MSNFAIHLPLSRYWGVCRMMLMSVGWVDHRDGKCLIAHDFCEQAILAYLGWVFFAGIIEEGGPGDSECKVRVGRDCQLLGWTFHHYHHRRLTKLEVFSDTVEQHCHTMTFVRVVAAMNCVMAMYVLVTLFGNCGVGDEQGEAISLSSLDR